MSLRTTALAASLLLVLPAVQAQTPTHPLNDSGITWSGHATIGNATICDAAHPAGQDCRYGRDEAAATSTLTKTGASALNNGIANGFDYTKISNSGNPLPASAALGSGADDWACTRDNVTGLIWEVKLNNATHLRHMGHTYTWYNTDPATNAGANGDEGITSSCADTLGGQGCNTQNYAAAVNALAGTDRLCGATDWRMPTVKELLGLVDLGRANPAIDPDYFPNTPSAYTWSGVPSAVYLSDAWAIYFQDGRATDLLVRNDRFRVRLVRDGR